MQKYQYLLDSFDDGVAWFDLRTGGDFDLDFCLGFPTFSSSSLSDFRSILFSSPSSDLESASESESVLELTSSVSVFECSPEKHIYFVTKIF